MASAGYVNERPILGCRVRALNDRLWVLAAFPKRNFCERLTFSQLRLCGTGSGKSNGGTVSKTGS
jgi:hypothetical protein